MPEIAKLLVSSKLISRIAKCASPHEELQHLRQIYIIRYDGKVMLSALNGVALAMRKIAYDEEGMSGPEMIETDENHERALFAIGDGSWVFPADLKIPNGLNVDITLYEDGTTVLQAKKKNAVYGPFERVSMLNGAEINIHNIFKYPRESSGSSRAMSPVMLAKLIAAVSEKEDVLIINASGDFDQAIYCKTKNGDAYGMILPIRDEALADQREDAGEPEEADEE